MTVSARASNHLRVKPSTDVRVQQDVPRSTPDANKDLNAKRSEAAVRRGLGATKGGRRSRRSASSEPVQIELVHRVDGFIVSLTMPQTANIRQVKEALISKVGRGQASQVQIFLFPGTEAQHLDSNEIGVTRKFWATGFSPPSISNETHGGSGCGEEAAQQDAPDDWIAGVPNNVNNDVSVSACETVTSATKSCIASEPSEAFLRRREASIAKKPEETNSQRREGGWTRMIKSAAPETSKAKSQGMAISSTRHPNALDILLLDAVRNQDLPKVQSLLDSNASPNTMDTIGGTLLLKAVMHHNFDMCLLLMLFDAEPTLCEPPSESAAAVAARRPGSTWGELFKLRKGRIRSLTMQFAVSAGNLMALEHLRPTTCDVQEVDDDDQTLLHMCAHGKKCLFGGADVWVELAKNLLRLGADVNAANKLGETPLLLAVRRTIRNDLSNMPEPVCGPAYIELCEEILQWDADVNMAECDLNATPLIEAVCADDCPLTKLLLDARGDPTHRCAGGKTAFSCARSADMLLLLIDSTVKPAWSHLERQLYRSTRAQFNPDIEPLQETCSFGMPCKVSVICPTLHSRADFHSQLYACFNAQSYPDKELVVVETGEEPSDFFNHTMLAGDPRITYRFYKDSEAEDSERRGNISIGSKRNVAIRLARGAIIAHFDDDDIYSEDYLQDMVNVMLRHGAHMLKLSSWFVFDCVHGRLGYCDPEVERSNKSDDDVDSAVYGYGFTYVYCRDIAIKCPFPDRHLGEDYEFLQHIQELGYSVCLWPDLDGMCLHLQHGENSSNSFPNDCMTWEMLESMQVSKMKVMQDIIRKHRHLMRREPLNETQTPRLLNLVVPVLGMRALATVEEDGFPEHVPEVTQMIEEQKFYGDVHLEAAFKDIQRHGKLIVSAHLGGTTEYEYWIPWTDTVLEAKKRIARDLGAHLSQVRLMDVEKTLKDDQLLLYRRRLQFSLLPEKLDSDREEAEGADDLEQTANDEAVENLKYLLPECSVEDIHAALVTSKGTVFGAVQVLTNRST